MSDISHPTTVSIDQATLAARLHEVEIIDVRTPGEFETAHIVGARSIPLDELERRVDEVRDLVLAGRPVVLLCRTQNRSGQAQARLQDAGLPTLPLVVGGMQAWQADGRPVVQDVLRWDMQRQIKLVAGTLVLLSIAASLVWQPAILLATGIGTGLVYAAVSDTCTMAVWLSKLPYNRPRTG
ncbi:MAG: rhodanese-like domain-containing protein [Nitriliruptoraceae bacterium]